jgi:formiminotetrahydrofolate cyclodeaminase
MREFLESLSSKAPAPGGGGASAFTGALAAALGCMVANLTVGKERYRDAEQEVQRLLSELSGLRDELNGLIKKDAEAFEPLAVAYGLPSGTDAEKRAKADVMEPALKAAALAPLEIMRKSADAIAALERLEKIGSKLAVSDVACGAVLAKAAMQSAWLNVCVNTKLMKDAAVALLFNNEGQALLNEYCARADAIYKRVESGFIC